ncbi:MAG TPA: hypothetical protein ENF79_03980 [Nitrososphaeria archaeon]|nr:hypothetical protein [Nitrososphaeria archaeon]
MLEYYLMLIGFIFTATTLAYLILYRRAVSEISGRSGLTAVEEIRLDEEKLDRLRKALSGENLDIETLLEELKEIRRQAEVVLDEERGGFEGEGGGDKGSS